MLFFYRVISFHPCFGWCNNLESSHVKSDYFLVLTLNFVSLFRQAYLIFDIKEHVDDCLTKFRQNPFNFEGNRLILLRWNITNSLQDGNLFFFVNVWVSMGINGTSPLHVYCYHHSAFDINNLKTVWVLVTVHCSFCVPIKMS